MSGWKEVLAPTPDCIAIERLGGELDAASLAHLETCARCQAELAMFREFESGDRSAEEAEATQWIAGELQRRLAEDNKVVPFRTKSLRPLYAAAAAILLVVGAAYFVQFREPSVDPLGTANVYRSARLEGLAPTGDIPSAPNELRWSRVDGASHYEIRILEIDATEVWRTRTTEPHVVLPSAVVAQFKPGKTLSWEVQAFRGNEILTASGTEKVRVKPQ